MSSERTKKRPRWSLLDLLELMLAACVALAFLFGGVWGVVSSLAVVVFALTRAIDRNLE
jgi:hypothetical protein